MVGQRLLDAVGGVQAIEHVRALRVLAVGLLDGAHQSALALVVHLGDAQRRQLRQQRLEARLQRRPALRLLPAKVLEFGLD